MRSPGSGIGLTKRTVGGVQSPSRAGAPNPGAEDTELGRTLTPKAGSDRLAIAARCPARLWSSHDVHCNPIQKSSVGRLRPNSRQFRSGPRGGQDRPTLASGDRPRERRFVHFGRSGQ
jgi:hypothetical protein